MGVSKCSRGSQQFILLSHLYMISESLCSLLNLSSSKNNDITKPGNYSTAPGNLN